MRKQKINSWLDLAKELDKYSTNENGLYIGDNSKKEVTLFSELSMLEMYDDYLANKLQQYITDYQDIDFSNISYVKNAYNLYSYKNDSFCSSNAPNSTGIPISEDNSFFIITPKLHFNGDIIIKGLMTGSGNITITPTSEYQYYKDEDRKLSFGVAGEFTIVIPSSEYKDLNYPVYLYITAEHSTYIKTIQFLPSIVSGDAASLLYAMSYNTSKLNGSHFVYVPKGVYNLGYNHTKIFEKANSIVDLDDFSQFVELIGEDRDNTIICGYFGITEGSIFSSSWNKTNFTIRDITFYSKHIIKSNIDSSSLLAVGRYFFIHNCNFFGDNHIITTYLSTIIANCNFYGYNPLSCYKGSSGRNPSIVYNCNIHLKKIDNDTPNVLLEHYSNTIIIDRCKITVDDKNQKYYLCRFCNDVTQTDNTSYFIHNKFGGKPIGYTKLAKDFRQREITLKDYGDYENYDINGDILPNIVAPSEDYSFYETVLTNKVFDNWLNSSYLFNKMKEYCPEYFNINN